MVKLTDRKIRWIIRKKSRDVLSTADIARLQNVSESRVSQLLTFILGGFYNAIYLLITIMNTILFHPATIYACQVRYSNRATTYSIIHVT